MRRIVLLSLLAAFSLVLALHPNMGFKWADAPPSADSLALQAKHKLMAPSVNRDSTDSEDNAASRHRRPRGKYIVVDTHTNHLYLRTADSILFTALCSTGTGAQLIDTGDGRRWRFDTPKGLFKVDSKLPNPWWRKPDWAFVEEGKPIPGQNANERFDPEAMGDFAIGFGDGYFIHGTILERLIGVSVTHGCVRLRSDDIRHVYEATHIGMPVIIY